MGRNQSAMSQVQVVRNSTNTYSQPSAGMSWMKQAAPAQLNTNVKVKRLIALVLDMIGFGFINLLITVGVSWFVGGMGWQSSAGTLDISISTGSLAQLLFSPWLFVVAFTYFFLFEAFTGTTPGKFLLGLRVVTHNGQRPALWQIVLRNIARLFEVWPGGFPGILISGGCVLFTRRHQRFGDLLARTLVVDAQTLSLPRLSWLRRIRKGAFAVACVELVILVCIGYTYFLQPHALRQEWQQNPPHYSGLPDLSSPYYTLGEPIYGRDANGNSTVTYQYIYQDIYASGDGATSPMCNGQLVLRWENPVVGWVLHSTAGPAEGTCRVQPEQRVER